MRSLEDVTDLGLAGSSTSTFLVHLRAHDSEARDIPELRGEPLICLSKLGHDVLATKLLLHLLRGSHLPLSGGDQTLGSEVVDLGVEPVVELHRLSGVLAALDDGDTGAAVMSDPPKDGSWTTRH